MRTWTTTTTVGAGPVAVLDPTTGFPGGAPHDLAAAPGGSEVRASVALRPRGGLVGRVLAEATAGLLATGLGPPGSPAVPRHAVSRMAREALPC